jgi:hypothetical protein
LNLIRRGVAGGSGGEGGEGGGDWQIDRLIEWNFGKPPAPSLAGVRRTIGRAAEGWMQRRERTHISA